jgi:hypothetical protein
MNEELIVDEIVEEPPEAEELPSPDPILTELASLREELTSLRKELDLRVQAEAVNRRNAERSAGHTGRGTAPEYYTPDEVRAMSAGEVRENYEKIRASMKQWH